MNPNPIVISLATLLLAASVEADPVERCRVLLEATHSPSWGFNRVFLDRWAEGIEDFEKFALEQYGAEAFAQTRNGGSVANPALDRRAREIYRSFRELGAGFEKLLIDPALVQRRDRFVRFVKSRPAFPSPWEARSAFRESTADVVVYRAMSLTEDEFKEILANGIESNLVRGEKFRPGSGGSSSRIGSRRYSHLIFLQTAGWTNASPFVSVSDYPEIAMGVSTKYGAGVRLFKIKLKEADLVAIGPENGLWEGVSYPKTFTLVDRGKKRVVPADDRIERLLFFRIPPDAIEVVPTPANTGYEAPADLSVHRAP